MVLGVHHDAIVNPRRTHRQCPSAAKCVVDAVSNLVISECQADSPASGRKGASSRVVLSCGCTTRQSPDDL